MVMTIENATQLHEGLQTLELEATRLQAVAFGLGGPSEKVLTEIAERLKVGIQRMYQTFWNE
jgi:hypothetical protein